MTIKQTKKGNFDKILNDISRELQARLKRDELRLKHMLSVAGNGNIYNIDPLRMPPEAGGNLYWDFMDPEERSRILGGMGRNAAKIAYSKIPLYDELFPNIKNDFNSIETMDDMLKLPPLLKDDGTRIGFQAKGFRNMVVGNQSLLIPTDMHRQVNKVLARRIVDEIVEYSALYRRERSLLENVYTLFKGMYNRKRKWEFGSGGSRGQRTFTTLTFFDLEAESRALAFRCLLRGGVYPGAKFLSLYNETHKGGYCLKRAAKLLRVKYYGKRDMSGYLTKKHGDKWTSLIKKLDAREATQEEIDSIGKMISGYISYIGINIVAGVQPSEEFLKKNEKGGMLTFMDIYDNRKEGEWDSVQLTFITGFTVPKETYEKLEEDGIRVFTTLGSTESMANATHPLIPDSYPGLNEISDDVNDLVAIYYPNIFALARYNTVQGIWVPAEIGMPGEFRVSNLYRFGTRYLNFPMDYSERTELGVKNIHRSSMSNGIQGTCADDATLMGVN